MDGISLQESHDSLVKTYRDGEPCRHRGCLNHVTHPCEGCGRIAGHAVEQHGSLTELIERKDKC